MYRTCIVSGVDTIGCNLSSPFWITEFQHGQDREEYITAEFEDFD